MTKNNAKPLTGDEIRAAVKHAHNMSGPSDATQPGEYVLAGALALLSKLRAEGVQAGDERAAFEAAYAKRLRDKGTPPTFAAFMTASDGSYVLPIVDTAWDMWKDARAALASAPVAGEAHTALNEWFDKTDFIQKQIASGELPVKYLGWHRADVMRDLIEQPRPSDDKLWDQTLAERDEYHDMADKLANAIADHLLVEIGEHSSSNCPWMRALEAIENAAPQASDAVRNQALEEAAQTAYKALFPTNDRSDWTEFAESASFNAKYAAQCIRALKSQSAALSAQPGAQRTGGSDGR